MGIEIDDSELDLTDFKREFENSIKRGFGQILSDAIAEMLQRIASGRDVNNAQFKPYSPSYKEYKSEKVGHGNVNLFWSGLMVNSIQFKIQQEGDSVVGVIYFANPVAAERASYNIALGRDFFGLSVEQQQNIYDRIQGLIHG